MNVVVFTCTIIKVHVCVLCIYLADIKIELICMYILCIIIIFYFYYLQIECIASFLKESSGAW